MHFSSFFFSFYIELVLFFFLILVSMTSIRSMTITDEKEKPTQTTGKEKKTISDL